MVYQQDCSHVAFKGLQLYKESLKQILNLWADHLNRVGHYKTMFQLDVHVS